MCVGHRYPHESCVVTRVHHPAIREHQRSYCSHYLRLIASRESVPGVQGPVPVERDCLVEVVEDVKPLHTVEHSVGVICVKDRCLNAPRGERRNKLRSLHADLIHLFQAYSTVLATSRGRCRGEAARSGRPHILSHWVVGS